MLKTNSIFSAIGIPIDCTGRPGGTELSPQVLREAGLVKQLGWDELLQLLIPLTSSPALIGASIACYNPVKDPQRIFAKEIIMHLNKVFCADGVTV